MTEKANGFDFETALQAIKKGEPLFGKEGVLAPLNKNLAEAALEGELDSHLGKEISSKRRNGKSKTTIKSLKGNFELHSPRDCEGTFKPQLVKKHQTSRSDEIEKKLTDSYTDSYDCHS